MRLALKKVFARASSAIDKVPSPASTLMWAAWLLISFYPVLRDHQPNNFVLPFLLGVLLLREVLGFYRRREYFAAKRDFKQVARNRMNGHEHVHLQTEDTEWIIQGSFFKLNVLRIADEDITRGHWISANTTRTFITLYIVNWNVFSVVKHLGTTILQQSPDDESFSFEEVRARVAIRDINKYENVMTADVNELKELTTLLAAATAV